LRLCRVYHRAGLPFHRFLGRL